MKTFLVKYGHTIAQGAILALQAYMLVSTSGQLTAGNYLAAVLQLYVNQHAREATPPA